MDTAHITVHSETAVTRIVDWCRINEDVECYVAPKEESSDRNPAERVVVTATPVVLGELAKYIAANGLKTEWEVESV